MSKKTFDLVVVGGGPGGYATAIRGAQLGMKTAVVEKGKLGGVCVNWGCIPSKALLYNAEIVNTINDDAKALGLEFDKFSADFSKAFKRSRVASEKNSKGVEFLMKKNNIEVIAGHGAFNTGGDMVVKGEDGKEVATVGAKNFIIATGGKPRPIPGIEFDGEKIMHYGHAIMLEKVPESIVIIGAGAIGVEFAYIMNAYGTKVTMVEMLPTMLPTLDAEMADVVAKAYKKKKIDVKTGTMVKNIKKDKSGVTVTVEADGKEEEIKADCALVAIGFMANTEGLGLEEAGIETDDKGWIAVDENFKTNKDGYYAIGDVIGEPLLAHAASAEGEECVERIAGEKTYGYDKKLVPAAIYCQPQVASVGLTEQQAKDQGYDVNIGRFPFSASGKARAIGHTDGLVKLVFDKKYGELLGAHICGHDATEMIAELTLGMNLEVTPLEVFKTIHAHPTLSEAVKEAAMDAEGHAIHI